MNTNSIKYNGLSENDNNLACSIQLFIRDRRTQNLSNGTILFYTKKIEKFLKFCNANSINQITDIEPDTIRKFLLELKNDGHNEGGIHAFFRTIKVFLLFWENEIEPENYHNPIRKIKPPRVSTEPIEGISIDDFYRLIDSCDKNSFYGVRSKTICHILLETGVRASELINIHVSDIDFSDSSILIKQGKGRKPRYVFIGKTVRKQIRTWLKFKNNKSEYLFTTLSGDKLGYDTLRGIISRLSKQAGISESNLHAFRRTYALEELRRGVNIQSLSRTMGHTSLAVLSRYLRQTKNDLGEDFRSIIDDN
jgi:integrase/recombinase XerD